MLSIEDLTVSVSMVTILETNYITREERKMQIFVLQASLSSGCDEVDTRAGVRFQVDRVPLRRRGRPSRSVTVGDVTHEETCQVASGASRQMADDLIGTPGGRTDAW
ncbi:hypothetical protein EYF80_020968 [Liparis tanakae]|uniref:Uncharacterized protein n=1 Tax=Liparis tanakae TaxID=230148 RepID=A0A4Z2HSZ9_9TELE|nr:hypothetical protein EYF80_020968 [Liparis tanakae]